MNRGSGIGSRSTDSQATSRSLLARVRTRDADAWDRLVSLYGPLVLHWCRRRGLDEDDAADTLQDVFHTVARRIDSFRHERPSDTFRGWLRVMTRNKVTDLQRRMARDPSRNTGSNARRGLDGVESPINDDVDDVDERQVMRELYRRALESVRPSVREKTWQAFWRTAIDGCSSRDVADELGLSPSSVRVAKGRVLQRLRDELGDPTEGEA